MKTGWRRSIPGRAAVLSIVLIAIAATGNAQVLQNDPRRGVEPRLSPHLQEVVPPQTDSLRAFVVPAYEGRVHFGLPVPDPARPAQSQTSSQDLLAFRRGDAIARSGMALYLDLLRLGENREIITADRLSELYTSARRPAKTNNLMGGWAQLLVNTAKGGLSDNAFRDVFCVDVAPCMLDEPGSRRRTIRGGQSPAWGAGYNEFRFRAGFAKFVDNYLDDLAAWGETLDRRAISIGGVRMQPYDFETGSYVMQLDLGVRAKASRGVSDTSTEHYDLNFRLRQNGEIASAVLTWRLPRDEARVVREKMQKLSVNQLFLVIRGDIAFDQPDRAAMGNDRLLAINHYLDITDDAITLYYDPSLTDEVGRFPLNW